MKTIARSVFANRYKESVFFHTFKFSSTLLLLFFLAAERFSADFLLEGKFHLNVERREVRLKHRYLVSITHVAGKE